MICIHLTSEVYEKNFALDKKPSLARGLALPDTISNLLKTICRNTRQDTTSVWADNPRPADGTHSLAEHCNRRVEA